MEDNKSILDILEEMQLACPYQCFPSITMGNNKNEIILQYLPLSPIWFSIVNHCNNRNMAEPQIMINEDIFNILREMHEACPVECFPSIRMGDIRDEIMLTWCFEINDQPHKLSRLLSIKEYENSTLLLTEIISVYGHTDMRCYFINIGQGNLYET